MISIQAKKHDNFSVEFKFGFNCTADGVIDEFAVNAWIFVPNSLDITPENYGKNQFYRDIKSNVRFITPVFSLQQLSQEDSFPLKTLAAALADLAQAPADPAVIDAYDYHLKMFAAIFKSALRDQMKSLMGSCTMPDASHLVDEYVASSHETLRRFRGLYHLIDQPQIPEKLKNSFRMCDEFMTHVLDVRTMHLIKLIDSSSALQCSCDLRNKFTDLLVQEHAYRKDAGYDMLSGEPKHDRELVHHYGMLKKFIESELYIKLDKKKDGVALQQIYYSLAAGVAMVFATAVSWYYQQKYGSVTWPLFIVLVISYMMKDRIKDLLRYYFAHRLGNKYYDKKAIISIGSTKVGEIKEGFDFISASKIPSEVKSMRDRSSFVEDESVIFDEKILLYRQHVVLNDKALAVKDKYPKEGVNEILRLHMNRFTHKMDNAQLTVNVMDDEGDVSSLNVHKVYYVNVVFQLVHDGQTKYCQFRIGMTRDGIVDIKSY